MGTLFILLLTSACFTDFQHVNDKNGLVKDDLQYGGSNDSGGVLNSLQARVRYAAHRARIENIACIQIN